MKKWSEIEQEAEWSSFSFNAEEENDPQTEQMRLIHIVKKSNNLIEGTFANINNDLNESIDLSLPPLIVMAYAYARRTAAAGLFLQGVFSLENYLHASNMFKRYQLLTGQSYEFQEEAAAQADELLQSYDERLDRTTNTLITTLVERGGTPEHYGTQLIPYEVVLHAIKHTATTILK